MRIKGWMGRADQTTKVKGMFVHPEQVAAVVKRHPEVWGARAGGDESRQQRPDDPQLRSCGDRVRELGKAIAETVRDVTKLRAEVALLVAVGSLPNDGKVISDDRKYD
jgi:phenylacetate-CoA ligase